MTDREKEIVRKLNHHTFTVEYLEKWLEQLDNVYVNAPAALSEVGARGFYAAVYCMAHMNLI